MSAKIFTDKDVDLAPLLDKTCAVIGYGAQGRAHALNLRDSGIRVVVGLLPKSRSRVRARRDGLRLTTTAAAVRRADLIFLALPDTKMAEVFAGEIAPHLRGGQILLFAHGFAIHYRTIIPPNDVDVIMVAPKGLGPMVRTQFVAGGGVPCVVAIAAGRERAGAPARSRLRQGHRRHPGGRDRDDVSGRNRGRLVCRAGGVVRRDERAGRGRRSRSWSRLVTSRRWPISNASTS